MTDHPEVDPEADAEDDDDVVFDDTVVRPYVVTRGRARPDAGRFDLISLVLAARRTSPSEARLVPEHQQIIQLCQAPLSVAEIASHLGLPVGTVRVLLGDLLVRELVQIWEPAPPTSKPDESILETVINGLRAL